MALGNIHLTDSLIQAVRDAVDVRDIAGEYTRLTRAGARYRGLCPLHKEKTPSFSVDPEQGLFYCFGCAQGGDAIRLHMLLSGDDFPAAIESLAGRYGIPLPRRPERRRPGEPDLGGIERALKAAEEFFRRELSRRSKPQQYLERRRISAELVERFRIGYAPDAWRDLLEALHPKLPLEALIGSGLVARSEKTGEPYDRFRDRLIFPIRNASGRLLGFGGRTLGEDRAKYINTRETARFQKGQILYGLDVAKKAIRQSQRAFLVEGYFDVVGSAAAGVEVAVASMGTALTRQQARLLARFAEEVVIGYDGDEAGAKASRRALPLLLEAGLGVLRAELGADRDPDSLRLAAGEERVRTAVAEAPDAVLAEIARLAGPDAAAEPRRRARAARAGGEQLEPIGDRVLRYGYAERAAARLGLPVELLLGRPARPPAAADTPPPRAADGIQTLEEKTLRLLIGGAEAPPPAAELPPPEIFLQPELRNIYRAFLALYGEGEGRRPGARELLARLPGEGAEVDRAARFLLEGSIGSSPPLLADSLRQLVRRWRQQRSRELAAEIAEAQRQGDGPRLQRLLEEKTVLSRSIHGRPESVRGSAGGE